MIKVWVGISVEEKKTADERIPLLLKTPAAVRFISYEPALGAVDLSTYVRHQEPYCSRHECEKGPGLDWVIVGGESGPGARPFDIQWARSIVGQCRAAGVACFVKQIGKYPYDGGGKGQKYGSVRLLGNGMIMRDGKGGDWSEWPEDLRVREFPKFNFEIGGMK